MLTNINKALFVSSKALNKPKIKNKNKYSTRAIESSTSF